MGCDIHMHIEVKQADGPWKRHDWLAKYSDGTYEDGSRRVKWGDAFNDVFYIGRNYDLFAVLANVRNGRGFAGCKTSEGFNIISEPRGLPDDVSDEVLAESTDMGCDGHSHSWLDIAEIKAFDFDQTTTHYGFVSEEDYKIFRSKGKPESWCGGVFGRDVVVLNNIELDRIIDGKDKREDGKNYYTQVHWTEKYRDSFPWFLNMFIPACEKLSDEVRLVFWFDN